MQVSTNHCNHADMCINNIHTMACVLILTTNVPAIHKYELVELEREPSSVMREWKDHGVDCIEWMQGAQKMECRCHKLLTKNHSIPHLNQCQKHHKWVHNLYNPLLWPIKAYGIQTAQNSIKLISKIASKGHPNGIKLRLFLKNITFPPLKLGKILLKILPNLPKKWPNNMLAKQRQYDTANSIYLTSKIALQRRDKILSSGQ